jgi:hypothetical protein
MGSQTAARATLYTLDRLRQINDHRSAKALRISCLQDDYRLESPSWHTLLDV